MVGSWAHASRQWSLSSAIGRRTTVGASESTNAREHEHWSEDESRMGGR